MYRANLSILILTIITFILACARQLPPPGGPVDTIPPEVVETLPVPGATEVPTGTKIELLFSERMNNQSVENAVFISPWPSEEIFLKWKGRRLRIDFEDTLKENRTYVLTIGAKSSDLRNNPMKDSFSMAFSTGDKIDEGLISGAVYSEGQIEGSLICAYSLQDSSNIDPTRVLADYYTQCNQEGTYQLTYVAPGNYRLFAIRDQDRNRKYTRGIDAIGITVSDVTLMPEQMSISGINFQLSVEDTISPKIRSAYAINQTNIVLRFSEEIAEFDESEPIQYFQIREEDNPENQLALLSCYQNSLEKSNIFLTTEKQSPIAYKIVVKNLFDNSHNPLDTLDNWIVFNGITDADTINPAIVFKSIEDSTTGITMDAEIRFVFSEAMKQESVENSISMKEQNKQIIDGKFAWNNPADVIYLPDSSLKSQTWYWINIVADSIFDLSGNSLTDSIEAIHFKTLNKDTLTAISGEFIDQQADAKGRIFLTAKGENNLYNISIDEPGNYQFDHILPGIYVIKGFRDADSNGVYSYGQAIPFHPAERFFVYPDSIKVRSRWPNEGNTIILK